MFAFSSAASEQLHRKSSERAMTTANMTPCGDINFFVEDVRHFHSTKYLFSSTSADPPLRAHTFCALLVLRALPSFSDLK
jgi:hypothetical protein